MRSRKKAWILLFAGVVCLGLVIAWAALAPNWTSASDTRGGSATGRVVWVGQIPGRNVATLYMTFDSGGDFASSPKGRMTIDFKYDVAGVESQGPVCQYDYQVIAPGKVKITQISKHIEGRERITPDERVTTAWTYRKTPEGALEIHLRMQVQGNLTIQFTKQTQR